MHLRPKTLWTVTITYIKLCEGSFRPKKKKEGGSTKRYTIGSTVAAHMVRVRGLHMKEVHAGASHVGAMPAMLFNVGIHLFNNGRYLQDHGSGPFLYVLKVHTGVEANVLEDVLAFCEAELGLEKNATKVTTLIETLLAIFRTEEIAQALAGLLVGQNCGRWDWLASRSFYLGSNSDYVHPDRGIPAWSNLLTKPTASVLSKPPTREVFMPWVACPLSSPCQVTTQTPRKRRLLSTRLWKLRTGMMALG